MDILYNLKFFYVNIYWFVDMLISCESEYQLRTIAKSYPDINIFKNRNGIRDELLSTWLDRF